MVNLKHTIKSVTHNCNSKLMLLAEIHQNLPIITRTWSIFAECVMGYENFDLGKSFLSHGIK